MTETQGTFPMGRKDERGMAFIIALLAVIVLMLMGTVFLTLSVTESTIASNEAKASRAFQIADSGIEHARRALFDLSPSTVLDGTDDIFAGPGKGKGKGKGAGLLGGNTGNLAGGSYTIDVWNNIPANGFPRGTIAIDPTTAACTPSETVDCDRVLVLASTGDIEGMQRTVEAVIRVPAPATTKGAVFMLNGTDVAGPVEIEDFQPGTGARIDGNDCNPPGEGGGPGSGPGVPGIAVQGATAEAMVETDLSTEAWGVTGANGSGAAAVQVASGSTMSDQDFLSYVDSLIEVSTPSGSGDCGNSVGPGPRSFGTWANPQICHVTTDALNPLDSIIRNGSTGAGILVIHDTDPSALAVGSEVTDFTYEGIIIVVGDGRFRLLGASRIYGSVLQKNVIGNHSGQTRLRVRDSSQICYSSVAIQKVTQALNKTGVLAWYETEGGP